MKKLGQYRLPLSSQQILLLVATICMIGAAVAVAYVWPGQRQTATTNPSPAPRPDQTPRQVPTIDNPVDTRLNNPAAPELGPDSGAIINQRSEAGGSQTLDQTLIAPSGRFIDHTTAYLETNPSTATIQSLCKTTPGATCQISFTKLRTKQLGDTVRRLPAQTTDGQGLTYWTWRVRDLGLDEGEWLVKAQATLGQRTESATDPIRLRIEL